MFDNMLQLMRFSVYFKGILNTDNGYFHIKIMINMLQLMRFSVYFKGILNTDNGYFHIKIMISAGHMLGGSWACSLRKFLKKKMQLGAF